MKVAITLALLTAAVAQAVPAQQPPPATEIPEPATPAQPPGGPAPDADVFVEQMAAANLFGIEMARLAATASATPRIRTLAEKIIRSDQEALDELQAAANESGVRFQANLTAEQAQKLQALRDAPPDQIDVVFFSSRMAAAQSEMALLSLYGGKGNAGALKRYALSQFQQVRTDFLEAHEISGK